MIAVCGNNPEKGIKYRHTWNIVKSAENIIIWMRRLTILLGTGEKMSDRQASKEIRYDYFNLNDKSIFRDHEPLIAPAPKCEDGEHFIIKKRNCHLQRQRMYIKEHCRQRKREECLHSTGAAVI